MGNIIKTIRYNLLVATFAVAAIIYFSGTLGTGEYLNNRTAYGYGGGLGYLVQPIVAINDTLYMPEGPREGRLFHKAANNSLLELEIPPVASDSFAAYMAEDLPVNPALAPTCNNSSAYVAGGRVYNLAAFDDKDNSLQEFKKKLTVSITISELPQDLSDMGIYYLDANNRWKLVQKAYFTPQNKTAFQVDSLAIFAVLKAPGLPSTIESAGNCFDAPAPISGLVLGAKRYAVGALLRTPDYKVYIVDQNDIKYLENLEGREGQKIFNITFEEFENIKANGPYIGGIRTQGDIIVGGGDPIVRSGEQSVLGVKTKRVEGTRIYSDGALIRTPDGKTYLVENADIRYVANLSSDIYQWAGTRIYDVDYDELEIYRNQRIIPEIEEVTNVKKYQDGELLRTRDWKVYIIDGNQVKHIATLPSLSQTTYMGKVIHDIDYGVLAQYRGLDIPAAQSAVLGVKDYANGTLLRTPDHKVYIVEDNTLNHVATLSELNSYAGQNIFNISFEEFTELTTVKEEGPKPTIGGPQRVLGVKQYADNTLIRTPDWKLYRIVDGQIQLIAIFPGPTTSYQGERFYDVDYAVLTEYSKVK